MANVVFYSTGEIFWVTDPPPGSPHIGVTQLMPAVPPEHLFSYAMCARSLADAGHQVIGAFGRQRIAVRERNDPNNPGASDPEILALGSLPDPASTVLVLIATDSGTREQGGVDHYPRNPFTQEEKDAFAAFRAAGGGVYVCWDHGPLGWKSLEELGLSDPIEYPGDFRPNVVNSFDSTDSGEIIRTVQEFVDGAWTTVEEKISVGPPAGYLQKIVPATLVGRDPKSPHQIFNGVGGDDGIWIPAHMHEGRLKVRARVGVGGIDDTRLPPGVETLAIHVPFTDTIFQSFAVMAIKDSEWRQASKGEEMTNGRVLWDSSFHHLVDINWVSDGLVPWEPYASFSVQGLWRQQLPPDLFEKRMDVGMKRLFPNAVRWLAHEALPSPAQQMQDCVDQRGANVRGFTASTWAHRNDYPEDEL